MTVTAEASDWHAGEDAHEEFAIFRHKAIPGMPIAGPATPTLGQSEAFGERSHGRH